MNNFVKDYFTFSRTERRGFRVLLFLIGILIISPWIMDLFIKPKPWDFSAFEKEISLLQKNKKAVFSSKYPSSTKLETSPEKRTSDIYKNSKPYKKYPVIDAFTEEERNIETQPKSESLLFYFDPNSASEKDLLSLGFQKYKTGGIISYRIKGGKFKTKDDFAKFMKFNPEQLQKYSAFILLPDTCASTREKTSFISYKMNEGEVLELNSADSSNLIRIPGVGGKMAARIITYRDRLGGFISTSQLKEIWGMDAELLLKIESYISVDPSLIHKNILINTANVGELMMHPYISKPVATLIVNYRKQHGRYENPASIRNLALVDEEYYRKLAPYLNEK